MQPIASLHVEGHFWLNLSAAFFTFLAHGPTLPPVTGDGSLRPQRHLHGHKRPMKPR
jgi:hypothetical protein